MHRDNPPPEGSLPTVFMGIVLLEGQFKVQNLRTGEWLPDLYPSVESAIDAQYAASSRTRSGIQLR